MTVTIQEILNGRFEGDTSKGHTEGARSAFEKCNNNFDGLKVAVEALQGVQGDYVKADGTVPLTDNWDINHHWIDNITRLYGSSSTGPFLISNGLDNSYTQISGGSEVTIGSGIRFYGSVGSGVAYDINFMVNGSSISGYDDAYNLGAGGWWWNGYDFTEVGDLYCDAVIVDTINESTPDAGVTVDSVELKDGLVDGRDVSADGTAQDSHIASTSNPHSVTAAQVGAPTLAQLDDNRKLSLMGF